MADINMDLLQYIIDNPLSSSKEIHDGAGLDMAYATTKRALNKLIDSNYILAEGKGKATKYRATEAPQILHPVNVEEYFKKDADERVIIRDFNTTLITDSLSNIKLFTKEEEAWLQTLQERYLVNVGSLSKTEYNKELERLAIDLSWKSSQIEGNTYTLLETERLLREKETADGKPKDDATMLLNHKEAIEFIVANPDYVVPLTISRIEDIHSILVKELDVNCNIRQRRVGISGTNYRPLDNEHQIRDAFRDMCNLVNSKENVFEKALLTLALISYIQGFVDGNKRTARIVSNAVLIAHKHCPLSFRTVSSLEYKKAMLIFYEQNNLSAFKEIFKAQFEFAVNTYF